MQIVATRCQILRLKCTKIDFSWALPRTLLGELTALPRPHSWNKGGLIIREGERCREGKGRRKGGKQLTRHTNLSLLLARVVVIAQVHPVHLTMMMMLMMMMMCTVLYYTAVMQFSRLVMSEKVIRRLLKQDVVVSVSLSDPNCKRVLYERGRPANYFLLVVEGHVQIHIGSEDFVFDGGPFMYFGAQALTGIQFIVQSVPKNGPFLIS